MEKMVTGIDQEELRKAREEMMAEMGITPSQPEVVEHKNHNEDESENFDDNELLDKFIKGMENSEDENSEDDGSQNETEDFDKELFELVDEFTQSVSENNDGLLSSVTENTQQEESSRFDKEGAISDEDLSHYDVFAQYEINPSTKTSHTSSQTITQETNDNDIDGLIREESLANSEINDLPIINIEDNDADISENIISNNDTFDGDNDEQNNEELSSDIQNGLDDNDDELIEKLIDEISNDLNDYKSNNLNDVQNQEIAETNPDLDEIKLENDVEQDKQIKDESDVDSKPEDLVLSDEKNEVESQALDLNIDTDDFNFFGADSEEKSEVNDTKTFDGDAKENLAEIHIDTQTIPKTIIAEELLPEINSLEFVNVLSMQEFKNSDNFTFVLGRSESGNILFESLKNCYNIAFFANNNSYEMLNTLLLSLMLKNSASEFKFALIDGKGADTFNYYSISKYLFGGFLAKTEEEILTKLSEVISELEARYHTLAKFNVRNIDEYNILAKSSGVPKLAHILLVIDGYSELMQSANFEKIKNLIYQILRLGRIAGIYAIIVTDKAIDEDIINFNLPARIGFRCENNIDSISMIGESGIDRLSNNNEFLYSSINFESAKHLRQPTISSSIIKILIDNIEK